MLLVSVLATGAPGYAQPAEIDWRSTLVLHFDPADYSAEPGRGNPYLAHIANVLEAGWFAEAGVGAIAVGPLFARSQEKVDYGNIDPSLGRAEDWIRLISAARKENVAVAVHLTAHSSSEDYSTLAEWSAEAGVRHFILRGPAIADVTALRTALDAASAESSWIAAYSESGASGETSGISVPSDEAEPTASSEMSGASVDVAVEASTVPESGTSDARDHRIEAALFDAMIEASLTKDLGYDASLETAYATFAGRSSTSTRPLIASVSIPVDAAGLLTARVLMLPGALHVSASAIQDGSIDFWRRIAAFRARHPAVGRGEHVALVNSAFTFARISSDSQLEDRVIVVLGASDNTTINVSRVFPDNTLLQDALTGRTAFVSFGMAAFEPGASGVILIEEAQ